MNLEKLMNMGESYATYVILGSAAVIIGTVLNNLGDWFLPGMWAAVSNLLTAPGQILFMGGFIACGVAGDKVPNSVRITALAVAAALFTKFVVLTSFSPLSGLM